MGQRTLETLERTLKHRFHDPALLERAVTHSSLAFEQGNQTSQPRGTAPASSKTTNTSKYPNNAPLDNEKLEFLGDAVLGMLVAQSLYESFPDLDEGNLTRLRAALVSRRHLGSVAESLGLGDYLRLGRGEERNGGREKTVLLANSLEAVIAALYLDAGIEGARNFVERTIIEPNARQLYKGLERGENIGDHKSALQEMLQAKGAPTPQYKLKAATGPDHRKRFVVEVVVSASPDMPRVTAQGTGTTKKKAEQEAARLVYQQLQSHTQSPESATA